MSRKKGAPLAILSGKNGSLRFGELGDEPHQVQVVVRADGCNVWVHVGDATHLFRGTYSNSRYKEIVELDEKRFRQIEDPTDLALLRAAKEELAAARYAWDKANSDYYGMLDAVAPRLNKIDVRYFEALQNLKKGE